MYVATNVDKIVSIPGQEVVHKLRSDIFDILLSLPHRVMHFAYTYNRENNASEGCHRF